MRRVIRQNRAMHGLGLVLSLLVTAQPARLPAPPIGVAEMAAAVRALPMETPRQGFWETVALHAGH